MSEDPRIKAGNDLVVRLGCMIVWPMCATVIIVAWLIVFWGK